jgi:hypothetical protein
VHVLVLVLVLVLVAGTLPKARFASGVTWKDAPVNRARLRSPDLLGTFGLLRTARSPIVDEHEHEHEHDYEYG